MASVATAITSVACSGAGALALGPQLNSQRKQDLDVYQYRLPMWFIAPLVTFLFGPLLMVQGYLIWLNRFGAWHVHLGWAVGVASGALIGALFLRGVGVTVDSVRMRFLGGLELRWDDVRHSTSRSIAGMKYVRVTMKSGRVYRPLLNPPGGGELESLILERLRVRSM